MAGLSFSLLILASLTAINADSCGKPGSFSGTPRILEIGKQLRSLPEGNGIQSGIEMVRDILKTEYDPETGPLDPLYIESTRMQPDHDEMNIDWNVTATTIKGLLGFEVTDVKLSLNSKKFLVDLLFPEISARGKYRLLVKPHLQRFKIYGNGHFDLTAKNLRIQINGDVGNTTDGDIFIENLESELSLETADFKVTGLLDNELVSEIASWSLSRSMPRGVSSAKKEFDELLQVLAEIANNEILNILTEAVGPGDLEPAFV